MRGVHTTSRCSPRGSTPEQGKGRSGRRRTRNGERLCGGHLYPVPVSRLHGRKGAPRRVVGIVDLPCLVGIGPDHLIGAGNARKHRGMAVSAGCTGREMRFQPGDRGRVLCCTGAR